MKLLLMGPPASGKGTIGKMLSDALRLPLISGGALLRALPKDHPRYEEIMSYVNKGDPAPQDFLAELYKTRVSESDCSNGFILDGWGRKMIDIQLYNPGFDAVLVFEIDRETALKRISGRRLCEGDGKVYNIYTLPKEELAKCTGNLIQRDDDKEEVVNHRYDLYETETLPVITHLSSKHPTITVDATPTPPEIFENVLTQLKALANTND